MSLYNAYDSKIIKGFQTSPIVLAIEKASLTDKTYQPEKSINYVTEAQDVPPFPYPIYDQSSGQVYVDARPYSSLERDGEIKIRNTLDEQLNLLLAKLEIAWTSCERPDSAQRAMAVSSEVFVRWISNIISHRFGLAQYQKMRLTALCALFSVGQFYNNIDDPLSIERHLQSISRNYPVPYETVREVVDGIDVPFPRDVDEFVDAIARFDFGPRMRGFNTKSLYTILNGSWWANSNASTFVAVALEYPPAMAALVKMAIENSMFKRTQIGSVIYDMNRGSTFDNHVRALSLFIDEHME